MKQVKNLVKTMMKQPVEFKYFDQSLQLGAVVAGNLYLISDVTRGTDVTQRIGNEIMLHDLEFRASFSINTGVQKAMIRYILLIDKQGFNTPTVVDILEPGLVGTTYTDIAPYYWDYRRRFKILHDEVVPLTLGGANGYTAKHLKLKLNLRSNHIGTSTTFTNQVYLLVIGSELNILNISSFQYHSRIKFSDE